MIDVEIKRFGKIGSIAMSRGDREERERDGTT